MSEIATYKVIIGEDVYEGNVHYSRVGPQIESLVHDLSDGFSDDWRHLGDTLLSIEGNDMYFAIKLSKQTAHDLGEKMLRSLSYLR